MLVARLLLFRALPLHTSPPDFALSFACLRLLLLCAVTLYELPPLLFLDFRHYATGFDTAPFDITCHACRCC